MSEQVNRDVISPEVRRDKIRGCLIGGAVGDALGYPVEFMPEKLIWKHYGEGGIRAYDPDRSTGKAIITDDTQMALFTANGMLVAETQAAFGGAEYRPRLAVAEAYQDWLRTQMGPKRPRETDRHVSWLMDVRRLYERRAPGMTCLSALQQQQRKPQGITDWIAEPLNTSKGCGAVMRAAPVGLRPVPGNDLRWLQWEAAQTGAITHGHSLGYMPCAILAHIVYRLVYAETPMTLREIVFEAQDTAREVFAEDKHLEALMGLIDQAVLLSVNDKPDLDNIHRLGEGWVGDEALAIAIYCALRYQDDFSGCMIAAVNHRGDSDSTGAVAGNILGALVGYDGIDDQWKRDLELSEVILEMADDLARDCPADAAQDTDWTRKYVQFQH